MGILELWPSAIDLLLTTSPKPWGVYAGLFATAFVKFAIALIAGVANSSLNFWEILLFVGGGASASVVVYTYFGRSINFWIKRTFRRKKPTSFARRRRMYKIWKKYGLFGVAMLCPVLSPMISVGVAVSFQESPRRIILYNIGAILFWTILFAILREGILDLLPDVVQPEVSAE
ncbi:MAG: hypothetical protein AAF399_14560 [Bacteroidota bacterium]